MNILSSVISFRVLPGWAVRLRCPGGRMDGADRYLGEVRFGLVDRLLSVVLDYE